MPGRAQVRIIFEDSGGNRFSTKFLNADTSADMHSISEKMSVLLENGSYRADGSGEISSVYYQTNSIKTGGAGTKPPA